MPTSLNIFKSLGIVAIVLALVLAPTVSLAKEKDRDREREREEQKQEREERKELRKEEREDRKEERKENRSEKRFCFKAFGHLIAPGWIKNNGTSTVSNLEYCWFPFGINKKFKNSTTTLDVIPPTIKQIVATSGTSTVSVFWKTNELAISRLWYSTSTPLATSSANSVQNLTLKTNHLLTITGLATGTPYYLMIESVDGSGNSQKSGQFTATTTTN